MLPCVKTNAYGHGIVPLVSFLMKHGVKRFLVAKIWEALQIREAGLDCGIINMDPVFNRNQYELIVKNNILQTVFTRSTAKAISKARARKEDKGIR